MYSSIMDKITTTLKRRHVDMLWLLVPAWLCGYFIILSVVKQAVFGTFNLGSIPG